MTMTRAMVARLGGLAKSDKKAASSRANGSKGGKLANSLLNWREVRDIRAMRRQGQSQVAIAKLYRVSEATISRILSGQRWGTRKHYGG